jgi:hypothetical protein
VVSSSCSSGGDGMAKHKKGSHRETNINLLHYHCASSYVLVVGLLLPSFARCCSKVPLDLALQKLVDHQLAIDAEGVDQRWNIERRVQRIGQTKWKHRRNVATCILKSPNMIRSTVGLASTTRKMMQLMVANRNVSLLMSGWTLQLGGLLVVVMVVQYANRYIQFQV